MQGFGRESIGFRFAGIWLRVFQAQGVQKTLRKFAFEFTVLGFSFQAEVSASQLPIPDLIILGSIRETP